MYFRRDRAVGIQYIGLVVLLLFHLTPLNHCTLLNLGPFISGLTSFGWLRSVTLMPYF